MFKYLKKLLTMSFDSIQRELVEFLIDTFKGITGDFINDNQEKITEAVEIVEKIAEFIVMKQTAGTFKLTNDIKASWSIDITEKEVSLILGSNKRDKSIAKHEIAYNWLKKELDLGGEYDHAIDLGINAVVASMHE